MSFYLNKDYICRVRALFQSRKKDMASALAQEKKSNHVINKYVPLREVMHSVHCTVLEEQIKSTYTFLWIKSVP